MGRPKLVIFVVWDVYMIPASDTTSGAKDGSRQKEVAEHVQKTAGTLGRGPMVTVLDPATGKTELVTLPPHFNPAVEQTALAAALRPAPGANAEARSWRTS